MKTYEKYKDSGVEWIGMIPSHWEVSRVKYLPNPGRENFIDGDWIESPSITDRGIRYITTGNIGEGRYKEQGSGFISEETFEKLNCSEVFPGDLIISRLSPPVGRSCIIPDLGYRIITSVDNVILRPKDNVSKFYLNYFFNSYRYYEWTELISRGTTLTRISRTMLGDNSVLLPPLSEQEQIVSFLDKKTSLIDDLINKKEQKIGLLKEYRTSLINRVITKGLNPDSPMKDSGVEWIGMIPSHWDIPTLSYLISGIKDGTHGTHERSDDGELLLSSKNVSESGIIISDNESRISIDEHNQITRNGYPQRGDVLITIVGSIGRSCVYEFDYPISFQRSVCFVRTKDMASSYFLNYFFKSDCSQYQLIMNTKTSTQGGIYINDIKRLRVILPPLPEQHQIVSFLDEKTGEIDRTIQSEQKKIELLKEYRQSLISSVITGKIKVVN